MADETIAIDNNNRGMTAGITLIGGEVRNLRTDDDGRLYVVGTGVSSAIQSDATLTGRMLAKAPTTGMRLWFDLRGSTHTNGTKYLFIAEAAAADTGATGSHRGVRVPLDANGDMLGEVQENTAFTWDDRLTADVGWT